LKTPCEEVRLEGLTEMCAENGTLRHYRNIKDTPVDYPLKMKKMKNERYFKRNEIY